LQHEMTGSTMDPSLDPTLLESVQAVLSDLLRESVFFDGKTQPRDLPVFDERGEWR
jgi:NAD(P)H-dependent FMN reductase